MAEVEFRSDMTVELIKHAASDADVIWAARVSTRGEQSLAELGAEPEGSAGMEAAWARLMPLTHAAFNRNGRVCP